MKSRSGIVVALLAWAVASSVPTGPGDGAPFARSAVGVASATDGAVAGTADAFTSGAFSFSPIRLVGDVGGGEPGIDVAPDGTLFVNWPSGGGASFVYRSRDGGATWQPCASGQGPGGFDSNLVVDRPSGRVLMNDLSAQSVTVRVSDNQCASWTPNPVTTAPALAGDRQWIAVLARPAAAPSTVPPCEAYQSWTHGVAVRVMASVDCGISWVDVGTVAQNVDLIGNLVGTGDRLYQFYVRGQGIGVAIGTRLVTPVGAAPLLQWQTATVAAAVVGHTRAGSFPAGAVDAAGNVHAVWQDVVGSGATASSAIQYAFSTDGGRAWSPAHTLSSGGSNVFPWIAAGDGGMVDAVWYHADAPGEPGVVSGPWFVHLAQARALGGAFDEVRVTPVSVHNDVICTDGTGCDGDDRDLLDFFEVDADARGNAVIAFTKDTDAGGGGNGSPRVAFVAQTSGPTVRT